MKKKLHGFFIKLFSIFFKNSSKLFGFQFFRHAKFQSFDQSQEFVFSSIEWEGGREHYVCFPYDQAISRHIFADGHFGWGQVSKVIKILGPEFKIKTLIDIGANIGSICIPMVKRGIAEQAIAFEPEPQNFRALMANIYINGLNGKITAHNLALDSDNKEKEVVVELSTDNSGDHRVRVIDTGGMYNESNRKTVKVKSNSLSKVIPLKSVEHSLIWMDTQGYEGRILEGAIDFCTARVPLVTEFWPYGLIRSDSYTLFKRAILHYKHFYDLSEKSPVRRDVTENAIDSLYNKFKDSDGWVDLLLV